MIQVHKKIMFIISICLGLCSSGAAQFEQNYSTAEILHQIQKLQYTGRVLYIAAHPDDENTRFISYMANGRKFDVAYLSLTRGDGGQNVIGPELRESLGLIRTQELLAARRTDGGQQFFTRANDFGYSKTPSETFNIWDRTAVLSDVVWVIRNFQPDIIVTRFNKTPGTTHGHHTASAILAHEAFAAAADEKQFKEQLKFVKPWKTQKLYWNTSSWFYRGKDNFDDSKFIKVDVGGYDPVLGESYTEIAAKSRSKHKSQAFGSSGTRGKQIELFEQWEGETSKNDLFDDIPTDWSKIEGGEAVQASVQQLLSAYNAKSPEESIEQLILLLNKLKQLPESAVRQSKIRATEALIIKVLGFYHTLSTSIRYTSPNDSVAVNLELVNRSDRPAKVSNIKFHGAKSTFQSQTELVSNEKFDESFSIKVDATHEYSTPYWLKSAGSLGMYWVDEQLLIGQAENEEAIYTTFELSLANEKIEVKSPLVYKQNDRIKGEVIEPFYVTPPVSISFDDDIVIFTRSGQSKTVTVSVTALKSNIEGNLIITLPKGWKLANNQKFSFNNLSINESQSFELSVIAGDDFGQFDLSADVVLDNGKHDRQVKQITYDHIPNQVIIDKVKAKLVLADVQVNAKAVGYIPGAGDFVPAALAAMGLKVSVIDMATASADDLAQYDAIVAGIRAYNTNTALQNNYEKLFDYMQQGGHYVVQYNTTYSLPDKAFFPYQLELSRNRITDENAEMTFVHADHQLLNFPNKIDQTDFDYWVQERGLYFPADWGNEYKALLSGNDRGESIKKGALLVAPYGEGQFIYTGLSFFRELPAGVPGAYRLFANLVSK